MVVPRNLCNALSHSVWEPNHEFVSRTARVNCLLHWAHIKPVSQVGDGGLLPF